MRFFALVLECSPGARSIEFVFDRKPEIEKYAKRTYVPSRPFTPRCCQTFHADMNFINDETAAPIQASDLLIFEWRKSLTYRQIAPERDDRPWFPKIRAARPGGALLRYDIGKELDEFRGITDPVERAKRLFRGPVIGRD